MTLYLSRLRLRGDPPARALSALLDPEERGAATDAHHRLIWSAFADTPERRRDFLWRAEGKGAFLALSARPPAPSDLFEPPEVKEFAPDLAPGDRLAFKLRANATKAVKTDKPRGMRVDLAMHALHPLPPGARAEARMAIAQEVGVEWLARQGAGAGFAPEPETTVEDYSVIALPGHAGRRKGQPQFGVLEFAGVIQVTDPAAFLAKIAQGFGRARAFGCGLMLIRRA